MLVFDMFFFKSTIKNNRENHYRTFYNDIILILFHDFTYLLSAYFFPILFLISGEKRKENWAFLFFHNSLINNYQKRERFSHP